MKSRPRRLLTFQWLYLASLILTRLESIVLVNLVHVARFKIEGPRDLAAILSQDPFAKVVVSWWDWEVITNYGFNSSEHMNIICKAMALQESLDDLQVFNNPNFVHILHGAVCMDWAFYLRPFQPDIYCGKEGERPTAVAFLFKEGLDRRFPNLKSMIRRIYDVGLAGQWLGSLASTSIHWNVRMDPRPPLTPIRLTHALGPVILLAIGFILLSHHYSYDSQNDSLGSSSAEIWTIHLEADDLALILTIHPPSINP